MAERHCTMSPREFMNGLLRAGIIKHQYQVIDVAVIETDKGTFPIGGEASWQRWLYQNVTPSVDKTILLAIRYQELIG